MSPSVGDLRLSSLQYRLLSQSPSANYLLKEYDASVTNLFSKRPYISLFTIQIPLPSNLEFWEAESAQAWTALNPLTGAPPSSQPFRSVLGQLFEDPGGGAAISKITHMHHQRIFVLTHCRMLWSLKEIQSLSGPYKPTRPLILDEEMNDTMKMLDGFSKSSRWLQTQGFMANPHKMAIATQTLHAIHMAHLHATPGLMDGVYRLLEGAGSRSSDVSGSSHHRIPKDTVKIRETAYHCAQVLHLARHFPTNAPSEPYDVFNAGITLWFLTPVFKQENSATNPSRDGITQDRYVRYKRFTYSSVKSYLSHPLDVSLLT